MTAAPADVLGVLDDYPTRSGDLITPVVVWCPQAAALAPNPDEVAAAHLVPVVELDDPAASRLLAIPESDRLVILMLVLANGIRALPPPCSTRSERRPSMAARPASAAATSRPGPGTQRHPRSPDPTAETGSSRH